MRRIYIAAIVLAAILAGSASAASTTRLTLVAYSTPKTAYAKIIPAFQKTPAGKGVTFDESYGASGDQARAVAAGLSADVVALALAPDVDELVSDKLVSSSWKQAPHNGVVARSVVVFVVRNGNPKKIKTWDDLVRSGVQVVTPNPFTSGGARWNVMAGYGAMLREQKTAKQARGYLKTLFQKHVVAQDSSARAALQTFLGGKGDVLLTYENEAILAQRQNQPVYYVIPKATIQIETPAAVTRTSKHAKQAKAFLNFLWTPTAQKLYGQEGYRPVVPSVAKQFKYPARPQLFTIRWLGGWTKIQKKFFDPNTGVMAKIEHGG
jgi:sulfate/thiosulfate-binding protein